LWRPSCYRSQPDTRNNPVICAGRAHAPRPSQILVPYRDTPHLAARSLHLSSGINITPCPNCCLSVDFLVAPLFQATRNRSLIIGCSTRDYSNKATTRPKDTTPTRSPPSPLSVPVVILLSKLPPLWRLIPFSCSNRRTGRSLNNSSGSSINADNKPNNSTYYWALDAAGDDPSITHLSSSYRVPYVHAASRRFLAVWMTPSPVGDLSGTCNTL